jgi:predicted metal-dependent phosphoesterase TrpH
MYSQADTHIHTTFSDGLFTPEETVDIINARTDLRVIAITDHGTAEGALAAQAYARRLALPLEVVIGQEVFTKEGDVVGLFLKSSLPWYRTALEAIEAIHAQGGLAVAVHPFSAWPTLNNMRGVGSKIFTLPFDAVEVRNGFPSNVVVNPLVAFLNRTIGQNLSELGGSDSHVPYTAGQASTWFPGHTALHLRRAIEQGAVWAGGSLWTLGNIVRIIRLVLTKGLPHYEHAYSD